jgi:phosphatidylglycerophosphatase C
VTGDVVTPPAVTNVVAFDVDGTLTTRDCVVPFLRRVGGTMPLAAHLIGRSARLLPALAQRDRDTMKSLAVASAFTGRTVVEVEAEGAAFARDVHRSAMRPAVVDRLDRHRADGDRIVLVSASFEVYLRPLAQLLGADDVLAVRLEADDTGVLTGRLDGANCRGAEKIRRLHSWLEQHHRGRANTHVTAYGDSRGDRELLSDADVAVYVGRGAPDWLGANAERL